MASSRRKPDRLEGLAADHLIEALRTCRRTLRDVAADLRFEAPAAHGCRIVIAPIDALAHLITGRPHLFAEQDFGTRRNQSKDEIAAPGGQAIVGTVSPGGRDHPKSADQPYEKQITHAPQQEMRSTNEIERETLPIPRDEERPLQDSRRKVAGSAEGE